MVVSNNNNFEFFDNEPVSQNSSGINGHVEANRNTNYKFKIIEVCTIPSRLLLISAAFLTCLVIISCATIIIYKNNSNTAKTIVSYNENCEDNVCDSHKGLICIEYVCQCDFNQYFDEMCQSKGNFSQPCKDNNSSYCLDNSNMICFFGMCTCDLMSFWNGTACVSQITYGVSCSNDRDCVTNSGFLICDSNTMKCACSKNR